MLRKLLLPIAAATLLAGCVTDYGYRGGRGDYYYGQPSVEYRNYGGYYGGFYGGYGYPYGAYGYYGYPYYGHYPYRYQYRYPYYRHHYNYPRPGYPYTQPQPGPRPPATRPSDRDDRAPWRNYDELRRRKQGTEGVPPRSEGEPRMDRIPPAAAMPRPAAESRARGSRMGEMYRRPPQHNGERRPQSEEP